MAKRYLLTEGTAAWIRKQMAAKAPAAATGATRRSSRDFAHVDDYCHPYTVRWSASANGGNGAWIIWLPSDEALLDVGKNRIDVTDGLQPVGGDYPVGWYVLDMLPARSDSVLYLNVSSAYGSISAEFSEYDGYADGQDDIVASVEICACSIDGEVRRVKPFVWSSIVIGDGGGAACAVDDVSIEEHNAAAPGDPEEPEHAIMGWHDQAAETTKLGDMLTMNEEVTGKELVLRNGPGGALHYIPIGKLPDNYAPTVEITEITGGHRVTITDKTGAHEFDVMNGAKGDKGDTGEPKTGSDYIDVPTTGTDAGKVLAKISPSTADPHALVTTDTVQDVSARKNFLGQIRFRNRVYVVTDENQGIEGDQRLYFASKDIAVQAAVIGGTDSSGNNTLKLLSFGSDTNARGGIILLYNQTTGKLSAYFEGTKQTDDIRSKTSFELPWMGWVNDKFARIDNIHSSDESVIVENPTSTGEGLKEVDLRVEKKQIVAGPGVSVSLSADGKQIIISATGSQQIGGFAGTKYVVTGSAYNKSTHYWTNTYAKVVYSNGLVTQWVDDFKTENVTQAVQETV